MLKSLTWFLWALFLFFFWGNDTALAQAPISKDQKYIKKIDRKITLSPFVGIGYIPAATSINAFGDKDNLFAGFNPLINAGLGAFYPLKVYPRLLFSAELSILFSKRGYYTLNINTLSAGAKFLFRDKRKKFNPYIAAGLGMPFLLYFQEAHNEDYIPTEKTAIQFGEALKFEKRIPEKTILLPLFAPYVALGAQYRIDKKYSVFLQAGANPVFGSQAGLKEVSPVHNAALTYFTARGGVNIQLMKPKPPYIDTAMIPIPDDLIALAVPEEYSKRGMLVLEGVFDLQLREGLKHNVRLEVGEHELIVEEQVQDPCKVTCYLYNQNGDIISRAESNPEGKIVFSDLNKGIYDLSFVLEKPCTSANFKYKFPDPSVHPLLQYNEDGTINDSITYYIEGKVSTPDTGSFSFVYKSSPLFLASTNKMLNDNFDVAVYLADSTKMLIAKFEPGKNESFHFKKLPTKNYEIIYKVPDAELKTGVDYTFYDNYKVANKRVTFVDVKDSTMQIITEENRFYEKLKYNLKGKVTLKDTLNKLADVTLYLVNEKKKILFVKKPEKDGSFLFKNLRSKVKYEVFYELENKIGKISINHKEEELVPLPKSNLDDVDVVGRRRRLVPDLQGGDEDHLVSYNVKGSLVNPKGYGVYVGAFENIMN
ncbi:MAG: collagen binding domain-containing protein, partial [Cytophagales bacterium]